MTDKVTPLFPPKQHSHQEMAEAAFNTVIMEGGEPDQEPLPDRLPIRITKLEMRRRIERTVPMPHKARLGLLRLREVPIPFYKFLFHGVGEGHHWRLPPNKTDDELHRELNGSDYDVHVLYLAGAPAGFFELDLRKQQEAVVINCFGLMPYARGRGLSRWFLNEMIRAAWTYEPPRLRLQTNDHDSPIALRLYQAAGFEVVGRTDGYLMLGSAE